MQKKVLILGFKGNLGQQLVKVFEKNYEVVACDREELDITKKKLVDKKIKNLKPDIIINAVAYNAVDKCEADEDELKLAKKINGEAPGVLARAALKNNAILIHYSSDYVFDGENENGYREGDNPNPINKYGETKLMGERAIMNLSEKGLKYYIIRTSKLFGPEGKSKGAKPSFFDIMLKLGEKPPYAKASDGKKDEIDVVDEEVSCFTYTPDIAKETKELIENNNPFGIYHVVNSGQCTWYEAAKELFEIADIGVKVSPVTSEKFPRPAKRPKYSVLLNTKLKPLRKWQDALKEYLSNK